MIYKLIIKIRVHLKKIKVKTEVEHQDSKVSLCSKVKIKIVKIGIDQTLTKICLALSQKIEIIFQ